MPLRCRSIGLAVLCSLALTPLILRAQVTKAEVPGVTNFAQVETTVACAGTTRPEAMADIKRMGFASIVNLRMATEAGADVEAEAAAARAAGLKFFHVPFSGPDAGPAVVDEFLAAAGDQANQPVFIHCATGQRAAAMWLIKRVQLDGWSIERASEEAAALGLTRAPLKQFALDYIDAHRK
jgi:uncharacterized protein (TIGR01244 family)